MGDPRFALYIDAQERIYHKKIYHKALDLVTSTSSQSKFSAASFIFYAYIMLTLC